MSRKDDLEKSSHEFEPEMILIPAGEFLMGSDPRKDRDAYDCEEPQHTLYLPDYYIAKTPVTNAQYAAFLQSVGQKLPKYWREATLPKGKEEHPVVNVSWRDAINYCRWLSKITGRPYRLPSEAEWEKAARGTDGRIYPWGDEWDASRCNSSQGGGKRDTTPVGMYSPQGDSPYGCVDMAGNVYEWTNTRYIKDYPYRADDGREDRTPPGERVARGGSWCYLWDVARCACRNWMVPKHRTAARGFRVCCPSISP
jgi:formylglycine-generating enzyme required for sulfatase activity